MRLFLMWSVRRIQLPNLCMMINAFVGFFVDESLLTTFHVCGNCEG